MGWSDEEGQKEMNTFEPTNSSTFEELVNLYARTLYSVSFRILKNSQDAEDVVQETFLKAFRSIDRFRGDSSVYTWLYRIAQNQSLMKLRKRNRAITVSLDAWITPSEGEQANLPPTHWLQSDSPDPGSSLHTRQLSEFVSHCIEELPESYRRAYFLKDVKRLSEDQVCRTLGISKPSMKSRVHRARLLVRQQVKDHFFKPGVN